MNQHVIVDPDKLKKPKNMPEAVIAKCHAELQCRVIDAMLKGLRAKRRAWNRRLGICLRTMSDFAIQETKENPK